MCNFERKQTNKQPFFYKTYRSKMPQKISKHGCSADVHQMLQGISSLTAGGPHAIQGKRGKVKTPLTNQAINHLAVSAKGTHSCQKLAEFTSLCKLLCCYKITLPPSQHRRTCSNIATLWKTVCLFLALAILDWLLPRTPLHLRAW